MGVARIPMKPLKMDGWNTTTFPIGVSAYFRGRNVSFREGIYSGHDPQE